MRLIVTLLILLATPAIALAAAVARPNPPVVVELYTAQGCEACAKANELLGELAGKPGVIALTFPVDYWDYLGWRDTFAKPEFALRQHEYADRLAISEVYTPQVIIDGGEQAAGVRDDRVEALLDNRLSLPRYPPDMLFREDNRIAVGSGRAPKGGAEVWLVRYDPREQEVEVRRGENRGQTIRHRNVVRELRSLGPWRGRPVAYRLPAPSEPGLSTAVLVQASDGGRVLGAIAKP